MIRRLVVAVAFLVLGRPVLAAGLDVTPITITLDQTASNTTISLTNQSTEAKRYELSMSTWGEAANGQMQLAPTNDLIFFPPLLTMKPGEQRNVRVGVKAAPSGEVEKTYRLFIQEMPNPRPPGAANQVKVLTRLGLPVFIAPPHRKEKAVLAGLSVAAGKASFALKNEGNVHVRPMTVTFSALDASGKSVFEKSWTGWYVLAKGERDYEVDLPADACKKATTFKAEANGEHLSISTAVQGNARACVK